MEDFGWARGATAAALSINLVVYAIGSPIAGSLVDRFGIRKVVPLGAVLLGLALAAPSRTSAIWQLYLTDAGYTREFADVIVLVFGALATVGCVCTFGCLTATVFFWFVLWNMFWCNGNVRCRPVSR